MKKSILIILMTIVFSVFLAGCGSKEKVINVYSHSAEVPNMVQKYLDEHPELGYKMSSTVIATTDRAYQPALDEALEKGGKYAPDIYTAEATFVIKYCQEEASSYAATYKELGIDTDRLIKESGTAKYAYEIGTRPSDNEIVGLPYQSTGGCFIYRRSIAKDTWGTDDPAIIQEKIGGGTGQWEQFFIAASELRAKGYGIISGDGDIWHAIENSSDNGWIVDGKLYIDPKREAFLDISKKLKDNDYHNDTRDWQDAWFADMRGEGEKEILGFFGPAWLINYTIAENCGGTKKGEGTFGDWAVCSSPVGFSWGGTWILANKSAPKSKTEVIRDIIQWITLNYDPESLQYAWANGLMSDVGTKDTVISSTVMAGLNGNNDFLDGQDIFKYFVPANEYASGKNLSQYDEAINAAWREAVRNYTAGNTTRDEAIDNFRAKVKEELGIE